MSNEPRDDESLNVARGEMTALVLDPCCGSRMMWHNRRDPRAVFGDKRSEIVTVTDRSHGNATGVRVLRIEPDVLLPFSASQEKLRKLYKIAFRQADTPSRSNSPKFCALAIKRETFGNPVA